MTDWTTRLPSKACLPAREWLSRYDDPQLAWDECTREDWMVWLLVRTGVTSKELAGVLLECTAAAAAILSDDAVFGEALAAVGAFARGEAALITLVPHERPIYLAVGVYHTGQPERQAALSLSLLVEAVVSCVPGCDDKYVADLSSDAIQCSDSAETIRLSLSSLQRANAASTSVALATTGIIRRRWPLNPLSPSLSSLKRANAGDGPCFSSTEGGAE